MANKRKTEKQLAIIKKIFQVAHKKDKFIFIKGGWNIDLSFGQSTRRHKDIDFHFDKKIQSFGRNGLRNAVSGLKKKMTGV